MGVKKNKAFNSISGAEAILESISDGVFTVDKDWRINYFNHAAEVITGVKRKDAIGKRCADVFRSSMCEAECALRQTVKSGKPVINQQAFIIKADGQRVPIAVSTAILRDAKGRTIGGAETFRDLSLEEDLKKRLSGRFQIGDLITQSISMRRILDILPPVAASDASILIQGETGTGKELLARAIHETGGRKNKPFVAVNCGALPETLLESELFGYVKGAFTGANKDKPGRFAMAEGGTLFLDEIGDIIPAMQVRLLRVLQERTYEPLGSTLTKHANMRVMAATNRDLGALMRKGMFREDFFYRLNVIKLELPPLRQRKDDIPILIEHFVARFNLQQRKKINGVTTEALQLLLAHNYPGNIRELENIIERAFVLCTGKMIERRHLPAELSGMMVPIARDKTISIAEHKQTAEAQAIRSALAQNNYNRTATARVLGLHKSTLFRKINQYGIQLPSQDGRHRLTI
jgi:PAS domain S-box-containing protein